MKTTQHKMQNLLMNMFFSTLAKVSNPCKDLSSNSLWCGNKIQKKASPSQNQPKKAFLKNFFQSRLIHSPNKICADL